MMELTLVLFSIFFITFLYLKIKERKEQFKFFTNLNIPGPKPNFIFGNILTLRYSERNLLQVMIEWEEEFGPIYGYYSGIRPILCIRDEALISSVLIKNAMGNFINRPKMVIESKPLIHTLVGLRDKNWKDVRSLLTPTFSSSKMKQTNLLMNENIKTTIEILSKKSDNNEDFEALELYQALTLSVIAEAALAMTVNCQEDKNNKMLHAVRQFLQNALSPMVIAALCFPFLGKVLEIFVEKLSISGKMTTMICESVSNAMKSRRDNQNNSQQLGIKNNDVLQLLMESSSKTGRSLSDDEIIANAWVFVLGGYETTANALTFTTYLLAMNSEIQEKLFIELENCFSKDEAPTYEKVQNLKYLDQIISESLRLYPPVVNFVTREAHEEIKIGEIIIPKNTVIQVPIWNIHRDPKIWENPEKFDPERFAKKTYNTLSYLPFGAGQRNCIGSRFAYLEIKLAISQIFRKFKIVPCDKTETNIKLTVPTVTIQPVNGIYLKCIKRN